MANRKLKKILGVCVATSMLSVSSGAPLTAGNLPDVYAQTPAGDNFNPAEEEHVGVYGPKPVENETDVYKPTPEFDPSPEIITTMYGAYMPSYYATPDIGAEFTDMQSNASYKVTATGTEATVSYNSLTDKTITEAVIPDTITINETAYKVTNISENAFRGNKRLTSVTLGDNITSISSEAFSGCTKLRNVTIGKNVTTIGANAFKNCKKIKTITIKSKKLSTKKIAKNAFKGVKSKVFSKVKVYVPSKKYVKKYKALLKKHGLNAKIKVAK